MILLNLLDLAKKNRKNKIIFITKDKIFRENIFFLKVIKGARVSNLVVLNSISSYLNNFGVKIPFINKATLLKSISVKLIEKELTSDLNVLPSYFCQYYNSVLPPKHQKLEILKIEPYEFYTYSEDAVNTIIITSLIVRVKVTYEEEKRINLRNYQIENYHQDNLNRIDEFNRPVYENNILFIFKGKVDIEKEKITNHRLIDFIIDWNVNQDLLIE